MKIVVVSGFTSSGDYTGVGGSRIPPEMIEHADIVIGLFAPEDRAIAMRVPPGVTVGTVQAHHARRATEHGSVTPQELQAEIEASAAFR